MAGEQTGRRVFAMEISPSYVDVALERWQAETGREAILDGDNCTFAQVKAERQGDGGRACERGRGRRVFGSGLTIFAAEKKGGMTQSRLMSLIEAFINVVAGYGIAVMTQMAVLPLFGLGASLRDNMMMGGIFAGVSIMRSYALRRLFETLRVRCIESNNATPLTRRR
jgi:hypothetical protein